ncbi:AAEL012844-PA [Aedes aegypti]|uniref:AAEL012844-PA n=1 Tax=Aedes aegypti TaxID=7159 RepID=Q16KX1_AEDAE|nr:AAEL012844-PA [Aedes aegypti]
MLFTCSGVLGTDLCMKAHICVDHCNASHVVLRSVEPHTSGKYSCEITEAAPSFHTKIVTRDLNVVDLPKSDPQIVDMKPFYGADEFLEVECISNESLPAARLEWLINDRPLGTIQPPSRLEFVTLPTSNSSSSSSSSSGSQSGTPSKKSTKSSLRQKQNEADDDEEAGTALDSNAVQYHSSPEFTVPVAAAVVASAAALSLTTASSQIVASAPALPSPSAVYSMAPSSRKASSGGGKKGPALPRYESAVSRLKLLLGHEHFDKGKIKRNK